MVRPETHFRRIEDSVSQEDNVMAQRYFVLTIIGILFIGLVPYAGAQGTPETQEISLSLREAVDMALENNLDIVVSRLNTRAQGENIGIARGAFKPLASATINSFESTRQANNQLVGAPALESGQSVFDFTVQQNLPFGLGYSVSFENQRSTTNSNFASFNPQFDTAIRAQFQQPLLKNLNLNTNQQRVVTARNGERIARHQFEAQVMDVVRDVEVAYWNLVQAIRGLEVAEKSLELAQDLLRNNRIQVEVGTLAPIDVLEAEAEVASREESVLLAQQAIENNSDNLKRLINDPESEEFWTTSIIPLDQPTETDYQIDVDEAVRIGIQRRPELDQSRAEMDTRTYNVRYTRNQLRPQVDLVGSLVYTGLGGTQFVRGDFAGEPIAEIPGGYSNSLDQLFGGDFRNWTVGLQVSYPVGHSTEAAQHAQAQVQYRQTRATIESQELLIAQEVRAAARAVQTNRQRIETTRVARELAQRRLEAEEKKFEVGMSTSFFIVQAQRDLTQAAANEVIAVIDYNKALVAFERSKGTLLERDNITVK
jgi:outer membrane protein TolC